MADEFVAFKFNFDEHGAASNMGAGSKPGAQKICEEAKEIKSAAKDTEMRSWDSVEITDDLKLWKHSEFVDTVQTHAEDEAVESITGHTDSDLVAGIYEGGFKLWEGAVDLCQFLADDWHVGENLMNSKEAPCETLKTHKVLELGCGHGLPGVMCLMAGAEVHFQDYNAEVLSFLTSPNVTKNLNCLPDGRRKPLARYFSGGFASSADYLCKEGCGGSYDMILSSETLYNVDSHKDLLAAIKQLLKPPQGIAFIASKTHYFGVGGGTAAFRSCVTADGVLECKVVWEIDNGTSNKREILRLSFPRFLHPYFS